MRRHPENREFYIRKTMGRTLRPYRYLGLMKQDRDNSHLAHEMVKCGKPACRCARNLRHRHGPYLYLRYEEYNRRTGKIRYRREYVPRDRVVTRACVGETLQDGPCSRTCRPGISASVRRSKGIPCGAPRANPVSALVAIIAAHHQRLLDRTSCFLRRKCSRCLTSSPVLFPA